VTRLRLRLILLLALPLASCWEGDSFYAASDSRPALPPGTYRAVPSDHPDDANQVRVSIREDGMTSITDRDGDHGVGFAPLGGSYFVMWYRDEGTSREALYALFQSEPGHYRLLVPICDKTRAIAAAAGAQIMPDPKLVTCRFQTRAQLEDGLRHLEGQEIDSVDFIPAKSSVAPRPGKASRRPRPES
jgi:hypothetical protein